VTTAPTVLVIDDSDLCLELVRGALEDAGFAVITCDRPDAACELVARARPACVVVDVSMPGLAGDRLVAQLRAAGDAPIVLHSAQEPERLARLARACDASGSACKSTDSGELIAEIQRLLRG
jgi:DNA-binding response OmpR family regulator